MTEIVDKYMFGAMVECLETYSNFYRDVAAGRLGPVSEIRKSLRTLETGITSFADTLKSKASMGGSAKAMSPMNVKLKRAIKNTQALQAGLENGTITKKNEYKILVNELLKPPLDDLHRLSLLYVPDATEDEVEKMLAEKLGNKSAKSGLKLLRNALKEVKIADEDREDQEEIALRDLDAKSAKIIKGYSKHASKVRNLKMRGMEAALLILPITPYLDYRLTNPKFLRTSGVKFTAFPGMYAVFEDQFVMAFDYIAATQPSKGVRLDVDNTHTKSTLKARKRMGVHKGLQEDFVLNKLAGINQKSQEQYVLMSTHFEHHPTNGKIAFAWIMPKRIQKNFALKGDLSTASWGWAWSPDAIKVL